MSIAVTGATLSAAGEGFILQYKETNDCTDAGAWTDVDVAAVITAATTIKLINFFILLAPCFLLSSLE